jgi:hypothetical protein
MVTIPEVDYQRRNIVVLISGKAGSGKTTVANQMLQGLPENKMATVLPFALGIKAMAIMVGWDGQKDEKGRKLLQEFGNAGRNYNKDIWVDFAVSSLSQMSAVPFDFIFIDDWRFPNEYEWFATKDKEYGVYSVRVHRDEKLLLDPEDADVSENSLPDIFEFYDYNIVNENMDLAELSSHARYTLQAIVDKEFSYED